MTNIIHSLKSQIKKGFFGALRIRKQQEAQDPTLALKRPATTVHVYDAVKARMSEALAIARQYVHHVSVYLFRNIDG